MAALPVLLTVFSSARVISNGGAEANQTVLWLALGGVLGILYSLGMEKFVRTMKHRHIFVRNAMLWLCALAWFGAALALAWIASNIYMQALATGSHLEGFDRILGVLIPAVVRADLIVDWARRVSWALLNMVAWVQGTVQLQRLLTRAPELRDLSVDADVRELVNAATDDSPLPHDARLVDAENELWKQDSDSLVHLSELLKHFRKLGNVTMYAALAFVLAVPAAVAWIFYAIFKAVQGMRQRYIAVAAMFLLSIPFAPLGAVLVIITSASLVIGVVTLSVVGTLIQLVVYWSTRIVYAMVRAALTQHWAGFPAVPRTLALHSKENRELHSKRRPEEAGTAMARLGGFFPTELEFALASWDGIVDGDNRHDDHKDDIKQMRLLQFNESSMVPFQMLAESGLASENTESDSDSSNGRQKKDTTSGGKDECSHAIDVQKSPKLILSAKRDSKSGRRASVATEDEEPAIESQARIQQLQRDLSMLRRLGLDSTVKTRRKRRLSTYYAFGILAHMQAESGGYAWRLETGSEIDVNVFDERISVLDSFVADEARDAVNELANRLEGMSKYRIMPSGSAACGNVAIRHWLRSLLIMFLESPCDTLPA